MKALGSNTKPDIFIKKVNYYLLLTGLSLIVIGFTLMSGGKPENSDQFSFDIYSFQRITVAPILVILGYVVQFLAIMYYKKQIK